MKNRSKQMERLTVTATLRSPVVSAGGYWTLDGLLAGVIFDQCQDVNRAHNTVPIRRDDGLYYASAAVMDPAKRGRIAFTASMRADHSMNPDLIKRNKAGTGLHRRLGKQRRSDFGLVMNTYDLTSSDEVTWYCEGDPDRIEALLQDVHFIGKRRGSGFGEVGEWIVEQGDINGVVGVMGEPMRPVPVDLFNGDKGSVKADAAWMPAYWNPAHRAICYVPEVGL